MTHILLAKLMQQQTRVIVILKSNIKYGNKVGGHVTVTEMYSIFFRQQIRNVVGFADVFHSLRTTTILL